MISNLINLFSETLWMLPMSFIMNKIDVLKYKLQNGSISELSSIMKEKYINEPVEIERFEDIAVFPVFGELVHTCSSLDTLCGLQSTFKLHEEFLKLDADPDINTIIMHYRTPGGSEVGSFEFATSINQSKKRIISFSDEFMTSLGYLLGSAGDIIVTTPTASVGSIGVILSLMKIKGGDNIEVKHIKAGMKKDYGSPYTEWSEDEINYFQDKVDSTYEAFVDAISVFRSWDKNEIKATQASFGPAMHNKKFVDKIVVTKNQFITEVMNGTI